MTDAIFWTVIGVVGGWIFLPEPAFIANMWAKLGISRPKPLYDPNLPSVGL
jgi:hypothetical protein